LGDDEEPAADAHDCIMVESSKRVGGDGRFLTAGSPQIDGRNSALPRAMKINLRGPDPMQLDAGRSHRQGVAWRARRLRHRRSDGPQVEQRN
jgi:hypothetical protein